MTSWYESTIDRQIREAQQRGEFDNLPGLGKPLPDHGREYEEDWWVKNWIHREGGAAVLPGSLALRRQAEDLQDIVASRTTEAAVREVVAGVNDTIRKARAGLLDGPPVVLPLFDPDDIVRRWREHRTA